MAPEIASESSGKQEAAAAGGGLSAKDAKSVVLSEDPPSIASTVLTMTRRRGSVRNTDTDGDDGQGEEYLRSIDEDDRMPSNMTVLVLFVQMFLIGLCYSIIIPTSRQYAESLGASEGFSGLSVGVVGFTAAFIVPLYRVILKKSYAGCLSFQVAMMQIGGVLYSLAQLSKTVWVMLVARMLTGMGRGFYPIVQFIAENVGRNHRSSVTSLTSGIARTLGLALGPIIAAVLVYVDFNIGEMQVNKETNAGWTVAILCTFQSVLIFWYFPKHGSQMLLERAGTRRLPEHDTNAPPAPLKERLLYYCVITNVLFADFVSLTHVAAWEVAATKVIQTVFKWNIQITALLVGGFLLMIGPTLYALGKLSYKYDDRKILLGCIATNICSTLFMFEYSKPIRAGPYLFGSFFFINTAYGMGVFAVALSSKVTALRDVEPVQAYQNTIGQIALGVGAIIADILEPNVMAAIYLSLSLVALISSSILYKRLVPSRLGV